MAGTFMTEYKGRRYPRYGAIGGRGLYALPCDEEEAEVSFTCACDVGTNGKRLNGVVCKAQVR